MLPAQVDHADAESRRIEAKAVAIVSPRADRPMMGLRIFQVYDPDANPVGVTSPLPAPKRARR